MITSSVGYASAGRAFQGVLVSDPSLSGTRPAVLVLHGGAGLGDHERERARRLAALGYVAFVPDLFGEAFENRAHGMSVIQALVAEPTVLRERVTAALGCLREQPGVDPARTAAIGFCFGGLAALELARSGADVAAVVSFHGGLHTTAPAATGRMRAKALICTGSADPYVTREHRLAFEDEMTLAGADWQVVVHGGALHGFTEVASGPARPGCAYHEGADRMSWSAMRDLFEQTLRSPVSAAPTP
jgi:dienelactone hydrolase